METIVEKINKGRVANRIIYLNKLLDNWQSSSTTQKIKEQRNRIYDFLDRNINSREGYIQFLIKYGLIPSVDIYCPDWDGSFEYYALLYEPALGEYADVLSGDNNNRFKDYFVALDYAIIKGLEFTLLMGI